MDDTSNSGRDPMLDMFLFESSQLIEQLEEIMLEVEKENTLSSDNINEIFRIMHTIKGSSAMMMYNNISKLAHSVEDLFFYIRENKPENIDISGVCDVVLASSDFIKLEISKIDEGSASDGDEASLVDKIESYLGEMKNMNGDGAQAEQKTAANKSAGAKAAAGSAKEPEPPAETEEVKPETTNLNHYIARLFFEDGSQMENVRAFTIYRNLSELVDEIYSYPADVLNVASEFILEHGFTVFVATDKPAEAIKPVIQEALFLKTYELQQVESYEDELVKYHLIEKKREVKEEKPVQQDKAGNNSAADSKAAAEAESAATAVKTAPAVKQAAPEQNANDQMHKANKLSLISVNVNKLDMLMNIVGEIVISESMVTKSPDLTDMHLDNFNVAARQLRKLTDELQDIVMSIRMVPVAGTFQKMQRIVRDMSKKLNKDVDFITAGSDTEVDKNIIDHLSDPLMHLIRNSMDHGVETEEERVKAGKSPKAKITLTAQNTGGDVVITVSDDGRGMDRKKIIEKARKNGLITKPESEMSENEIYSLILLPGFSTNEIVTEYSGRGVGMDVVKQNIEKVGGNVTIKSTFGEGTTTKIVIPLTLAITDAMQLSVGKNIYTLPTIAIMESMRPKEEDIIYDNNGNEMIMIRGRCYSIIRLHRLFNLETDIKKLSEGILIMIEGENDKAACIFADQLLGEQQVVVKPLPKYISDFGLKNTGIEGCTILGNGSISLILNSKGIINMVI